MDLSPAFLHKLKKVLLLFYTVFMLWLLFGRNRGGAVENYWEQLEEHMILTPFQTIRSFLCSLQHGSLTQKRLAIVNLVGNVIMFIPFGYLLPSVFPAFRRYFRFFLLCLGLICLVEILQFVTLLGVMDVDDVILNMAGFSLGYGAYKLLPTILSSQKHKGDNNERTLCHICTYSV